MPEPTQTPAQPSAPPADVFDNFERDFVEAPAVRQSPGGGAAGGPAAATTPPAAPRHPRDLLDMADAVGIAPELIERSDTASLRGMVQYAAHQLRQASGGFGTPPRGTPAAPAAQLAAPAAPPPPPPNPLLEGFDEREYDPALASTIRRMAAEMLELRNQNQELRQGLGQTRASQSVGVIDRIFGKLNERFNNVFGVGTAETLGAGSREMRRRIAVLTEAGIDPSNPPPPQELGRKLHAAARSLYDETSSPPPPPAAPAPPQRGPVNLYGGSAAQSPPPPAPAGNAPTADEWQLGGVVQPSNRHTPRGRGEAAAIKAIAEMMPGDQGGTEIDGFL